MLAILYEAGSHVANAAYTSLVEAAEYLWDLAKRVANFVYGIFAPPPAAEEPPSQSQAVGQSGPPPTTAQPSIVVAVSSTNEVTKRRDSEGSETSISSEGPDDLDGQPTSIVGNSVISDTMMLLGGTAKIEAKRQLDFLIPQGSLIPLRCTLMLLMEYVSKGSVDNKYLQQILDTVSEKESAPSGRIIDLIREKFPAAVEGTDKNLAEEIPKYIVKLMERIKGSQGLTAAVLEKGLDHFCLLVARDRDTFFVMFDFRLEVLQGGPLVFVSRYFDKEVENKESPVAAAPAPQATVTLSVTFTEHAQLIVDALRKQEIGRLKEVAKITVVMEK